MSFNPEYTEEEPSIESIENLAGFAVLEFGAPWCEFCQASTSFVEASLTGRLDLEHIKVYDGKGKRLGRAFQVKLWPTLIALHNGKEVARVIRPASTDELLKMLDAFK
ncbi:thioredoxin family protein [Reinekea sp.]|jgi:thioredoxin 1|uniref:thioredoxin family protein n=1 Tax=Reinekea sp. TaxID=1970455 RepID=UPI00398A1E5F